MGVHQKEWFIVENPKITWMIWGTPILGNLHMGLSDFQQLVCLYFWSYGGISTKVGGNHMK